MNSVQVYTLGALWSTCHTKLYVVHAQMYIQSYSWPRLPKYINKLPIKGLWLPVYWLNAALWLVEFTHKMYILSSHWKPIRLSVFADCSKAAITT